MELFLEEFLFLVVIQTRILYELCWFFHDFQLYSKKAVFEYLTYYKEESRDETD
jgi:hypothetical protein